MGVAHARAWRFHGGAQVAHVRTSLAWPARRLSSRRGTPPQQLLRAFRQIDAMVGTAQQSWKTHPGLGHRVTGTLQRQQLRTSAIRRSPRVFPSSAPPVHAGMDRGPAGTRTRQPARRLHRRTYGSARASQHGDLTTVVRAYPVRGPRYQQRGGSALLGAHRRLTSTGTDAPAMTSPRGVCAPCIAQRSPI